MADRLFLTWNLQRLLAPTASSLGRALDATPATGWDRGAYEAKLEAVAAVLRHVTGGEQPALLVFVEVEDTQVARDLLARLGWPDLEVVVDPGSALVGDDVVVVYDRTALTVSGLPISHNFHRRFSTRDVFEVPFATASGGRFLLLANHWPSRRISNSEPLRLGLADNCSRIIESHLKFAKEDLVDQRGRWRLPPSRVLAERWDLPVLVVGDLNDGPYDASVSEVLGATRDRRRLDEGALGAFRQGRLGVAAYLRRRPPLWNPTWELLVGDGPTGTHYWDGEWYQLEQVVLSRGATVGSHLTWVDGSLALHAPRRVPGLAGVPVGFCSAKGIPKAFDAATRTGVSDHLPLTWRMLLR